MAKRLLKESIERAIGLLKNIARTDYNAGNKTQGIPDIHFHLFERGYCSSINIV